MNPCRLRGVLVCLLLAHTVLASENGEHLKKYKAAKKHYAASNYSVAKATLAPLTRIDKKNNLVPYALFYYALSSYHNGEPSLAEDTS